MNFQQPHSAHFEPNPTFFKSQTSPIEQQLTQGISQTQFQTNVLSSGPPTFYFKERKGRLNWEKLKSADIDQLRAGANIPALESFLGNLTYASLTEEDCERFQDPVLLKMFRVSQYALEYLLNYQTYLYGQTQSLDLAYKQGEENLKPLEAKARAYQAEIQKRKDDLKAKKKVLAACEKAIKNPIFKCRECNKYFKTRSFLDEHVQRRHATTKAKSIEKVILKETATSPMLPKKTDNVSISTTNFSSENKENERQLNRRSVVAAPVTVERGVLTEGAFEEKNNLITQNLEALDQVKEMLKEMKQDDGKKQSQIEETVRGKLEEILSTNNEIGKRVHQIEQKVDMYNLNVSRQFISNMTHEEDVDREKSRSLEKEKMTNYYTGSSFKEQRPKDDVDQKLDGSFHALKGMENQYEEEDEEERQGEREEKQEEKEKEKTEDIKVQEMYDDQEDFQIVPKVSRLRQARQEKKEEKVKEEKARAKERENREFIENLNLKENFGGFEKLVEDAEEPKIESYNKKEERYEKEQDEMNSEEIPQSHGQNVQTPQSKEEYEEENTGMEEVKEEARSQGRTIVEKSQPVEEETEEITRKSEKDNVNVLRNSAAPVENQEEQKTEEKPEDVVLSRRKKDWREDVMKASNQIDPRVQEKAFSSVKSNEEAQDIQEIQEREDDPAYEDEDERERTMRIIENSMGIRGDEDNQMEKERKAYLKARKTMSLKYSMKIIPNEEVNKAEEQIHLDMKNSFKNLFGAEYDALAGKEVMDLESILARLKGLNEQQKMRFTKMKTDYSRIQRKSILEDDQTNEQQESLKGEQALLPKEINDYDEEQSIQETSMRLQKAKASLAELENVIYESKLN